MGKQKFKVVNVQNLTPKQLEEVLNGMDLMGYKRVFQSSIEWYQDKGEWGVITFELKED